MALAGNIKEFGLADIFQIVSLQQKTGMLTVESSDGKVTILLENGYIVGADATFRSIEERIGQILIRNQKVTKFQMKRITEIQKKTLQPIWSSFAESGEIELQELQQIVSQQIHETIYAVLRWTEGEYRFEPKKTVEYDKKVVEPINTEFLVMEGFRITDEWSEIEREISSFQLRIRRTADPSTSLDELTDAEKKVYDLITAEKTVQEIIDASRLGEFDTCQTIYELMHKKLIERVQEKAGKAAKIKKPALNIQELLQKIAAVVIGIAIIGGVMLSFKYIPENFMLIHKPNIKVMRQIRRIASQYQLQHLSQKMSLFQLERQKFPDSLEELLEEKFVTSEKNIKDPWGNPYNLQATQEGVELRGAGEDQTFDTNDDVRLAIPR